MKSFYIILIALSGIYLAAQLVAQIFYGTRFFPDSGELFTDKKDKNLWQTVFPKDMLRLVIFVFTGSVAGLLLDTAGFAGWISMPLGAVAGLVVNFLINTVFIPITDKFRESGEPKSEELEGLSAKVVDEISEDGFGVISVRHGKKSYLFRAISANGRTLEKGCSVIVIYMQDECCFVESEERFCDVLFEDSEDENEDFDGENPKKFKKIEKST